MSNISRLLILCFVLLFISSHSLAGPSKVYNHNNFDLWRGVKHSKRLRPSIFTAISSLPIMVGAAISGVGYLYRLVEKNLLEEVGGSEDQKNPVADYIEDQLSDKDKELIDKLEELNSNEPKYNWDDENVVAREHSIESDPIYSSAKGDYHGFCEDGICEKIYDKKNRWSFGGVARSYKDGEDSDTESSSESDSSGGSSSSESEDGDGDLNDFGRGEGDERGSSNGSGGGDGNEGGDGNFVQNPLVEIDINVASVREIYQAIIDGANAGGSFDEMTVLTSIYFLEHKNVPFNKIREVFYLIEQYCSEKSLLSSAIVMTYMIVAWRADQKLEVVKCFNLVHERGWWNDDFFANYIDLAIVNGEFDRAVDLFWLANGCLALTFNQIRYYMQALAAVGRVDEMQKVIFMLCRYKNKNPYTYEQFQEFFSIYADQLIQRNRLNLADDFYDEFIGPVIGNLGKKGFRFQPRFFEAYTILLDKNGQFGDAIEIFTILFERLKNMLEKGRTIKRMHVLSGVDGRFVATYVLLLGKNGYFTKAKDIVEYLLKRDGRFCRPMLFEDIIFVYFHVINEVLEDRTLTEIQRSEWLESAQKAIRYFIKFFKRGEEISIRSIKQCAEGLAAYIIIVARVNYPTYIQEVADIFVQLYERGVVDIGNQELQEVYKYLFLNSFRLFLMGYLEAEKSNGFLDEAKKTFHALFECRGVMQYLSPGFVACYVKSIASESGFESDLETISKIFLPEEVAAINGLLRNSGQGESSQGVS